jgi:hypothetical protein
MILDFLEPYHHMLDFLGPPNATLDFRYDGDTVDLVPHVVEVFGRFSCIP